MALAIFSLVGLALFSWLGSNLFALQRIEAKQKELADTRNALSLLETINPLLEPEGTRELGNLTMRWTSEPIVERRTGKGPSGGVTVFDLALFRMKVEIGRDGATRHEFEVTRAGWETVRTSMPNDF